MDLHRLALAAAALALLAGCAPDTGTVTARKLEVSCIKTNCDPVWTVQVTDPTHRHPVYTDRPDSGWTKVSEAEYERCLVGTAWPACKGGPS